MHMVLIKNESAIVLLKIESSRSEKRSDMLPEYGVLFD